MENAKSRYIQATLFLLALLLLVGCAAGDDTGETVLWIVTEPTGGNGMNVQLACVMEEFETQYPEVSFQVTILPTDEGEREILLEQLRIQIMAGEGPDIYLLPTSDTVYLSEYTDGVRVKALFTDIYQAMQMGVFADISEYYESDETLEKDRLVTEVMAAGAIDGARYVLPLRYDYRVLYTYLEDLRSFGLEPEDISSNLLTLMRRCTEDPNLADSSTNHWTSLWAYSYSDFLDYGTSTVSLTQAQIGSYLSAYEALCRCAGPDHLKYTNTTVSDYVTGYVGFYYLWPAVNLDRFSKAVEYAAVGKAEGKTLLMLPLRSDQDELIGTVQYFAAVGANCRDVGLAYGFISRFLDRGYQWEGYREEAYTSLSGNGWPVLSDGAVEPLWQILRIRSNDVIASEVPNNSAVKARRKTIRNMVLSQSDIPIYDTVIDQVRFPLMNDEDMSDVLEKIAFAVQEGYDIDTEALAESVWYEMLWNLGEG